MGSENFMHHLPPGVPQTYNNYKTVKCKFFEDPTRCKFGKHCTFAHSVDELRRPHEELPQNSINIGMTSSLLSQNLVQPVFKLSMPKFTMTRPDDPIVQQQVLEISKLFTSALPSDISQGMQML